MPRSKSKKINLLPSMGDLSPSDHLFDWTAVRKGLLLKESSRFISNHETYPEID